MLGLHYGTENRYARFDRRHPQFNDTRLEASTRAPSVPGAKIRPVSPSCMWCRRAAGTEILTFGWRETGLTLCPMCARLLAPSAYESDLHDELDVRYLAQEALDQRLGEVFASGNGSPDRCWWCARPAAPVDCTVHEGGQLLFDAPVLCDVCFGLSGHVGGGFADVDDDWSRAVETALDVLDRERTAPASGLRERSVELVLAKLALLEIEARCYSLVYPGDGFSELASSLGLAEPEARAQILRLWNEPDSIVTFRRFDDGVLPVLSAAGRRRLVDLQQQLRSGSPYRARALRSASLRRTLERLEAELQSSRR
jgi:hypothetical protein